MAYFDYPEYVPVRVRRAKAEKKLRQLRKKNPRITPVILEGRSLAKTWWGKSWNRNLERYADYHNRIERGRSYVRHGAVLDLQLRSGKVTALVQGSSSQPYKIAIKVDKLNARNWTTIRQACEGQFDSLSDLLAGKFPQALQDLFFAQGSGLFPEPRDIHFDCSCPDWASMCKHVAAALYGIGARLDDDPSLFFTLRQIAIDDIITETITETTQALLHKSTRQSANVLDDADLGAVFGIELGDADIALPDLPAVSVQASTTHKTQKTAGKSRRKRRVDTPKARVVTKATRPRSVEVQPSVSTGTMLEAVVKAVGKARRGKTIDQLQDKLGWSKIQVRNAISRAGAKGLVESLKPGVYRRKV